MVLVDTDVLIWHLRGHPSATRRLDQLPNLTVSAITWMELLQGVRNRAEMLALQKSFEMRKATRLPLTPAVTDRAIALMEGFALSHGLQVADALVAATALESAFKLLTGNARHFAAIAELEVEHFP